MGDWGLKGQDQGSRDQIRFFPGPLEEETELRMEVAFLFPLLPALPPTHTS